MYLFRRLTVHSLKGIRLCLSGDQLGAAFEGGRFWGHATLIFDAWLNKLRRSNTREVSGDWRQARVTDNGITAQ